MIWKVVDSGVGVPLGVVVAVVDVGGCAGAVVVFFLGAGVDGAAGGGAAAVLGLEGASPFFRLFRAFAFLGRSASSILRFAILCFLRLIACLGAFGGAGEDMRACRQKSRKYDDAGRAPGNFGNSAAR